MERAEELRKTFPDVATQRWRVEKLIELSGVVPGYIVKVLLDERDVLLAGAHGDVRVRLEVDGDVMYEFGLTETKEWRNDFGLPAGKYHIVRVGGLDEDEDSASVARSTVLGYIALRRWPEDIMWDAGVLYDTEAEARLSIDRMKKAAPDKVFVVAQVVSLTTVGGD